MTPVYFDQRRVLIMEDDGTELAIPVYVNSASELPAAVEDAIEQASALNADRVVIEGRHRLNDYVGSPIWSGWIELDVITPAELP